MAVEFVVAAPALALLLLIVAGGGQWLNLTGEVSAAARDAARAASVARTFQDAQQNATTAAQDDLSGICQGGLTVGPPQPVTGGTPASFATAQDIVVTVSCNANLSVFQSVGFSVSQTFSNAATAPLDPFVNRSG